MGNSVKFDGRNYRKHGDRNRKLIRKSLDELGAGRSIVIDAEGEIIGGNGVFEAYSSGKVRKSLDYNPVVKSPIKGV